MAEYMIAKIPIKVFKKYCKEHDDVTIEASLRCMMKNIISTFYCVPNYNPQSLGLHSDDMTVCCTAYQQTHTITETIII